MPSPFPGMNPYLEREDVWPDFHHRLIDRMAEAIADQVDPRYLVKIEEHLYVQESPELPHRAGPRADIGVKRGEGAVGQGPGLALLEAPARITIPWPDVEHQAYLEIRDRASRELVTVLELLSPANKVRHRGQHVRERDQVIVSTSHLVEIDLLRGGEPMPSPDRPACVYSVVVSRADRRPEADFWPIRLREPLPIIPIPLREPDRDATLDLQDLLHRVHEAGRYARYIFDSQPSPPLSAEDAEWARGIVAAARDEGADRAKG
ncbi:hypothetical protein OJF2_48820 [Aquisphaera giovannonii]|uniref:DUF4058 domain-containing protein n=1 Tax=Aquisphaera giovannonii TaxID=406548 RepID=A0A5B9W8I5_9BACT|nr:DUF4058 family protein [Aquisphaera giovannonii]QEH36321.1 hypothetical protein OJF2_48820 [Aquisphaera giovannonii]